MDVSDSPSGDHWLHETGDIIQQDSVNPPPPTPHSQPFGRPLGEAAPTVDARDRVSCILTLARWTADIPRKVRLYLRSCAARRETDC